MNNQAPAEETKTQMVPLNIQAREIMMPVMEELAPNLPANIKPEKFQAAFITAVVNNPDILKCKASSIRTALMKCAADGLVPDGRKAALVPFKGMATYMPMSEGMMDRAKELGDAFSFTAEVVCAKDEFTVNMADPADTQHTFGKEVFGDRGDIIGVYAIFRSKDGHPIHRELMSIEEVEKARKVSRMGNSGPWQNWYSEMCRKTCIRRGIKYVPVSQEFRTIVERDDEHVEFKRVDTTPEGYNPLVEAPQTVEGTTNELDKAIDNYEPEIIPPITKEEGEQGQSMINTIGTANTVEALSEWQADMSSEIANLHPIMKAEVRQALKNKAADLREALQ